MGRKKIQVAMKTYEELTNKQILICIDDELRKIRDLRNIANSFICTNNNIHNGITSIRTYPSMNMEVVDNIERLRRNAASNRIICSILEDNIDCMVSEMKRIQFLLNSEIEISHESTCGDTRE